MENGTFFNRIFNFLFDLVLLLSICFSAGKFFNFSSFLRIKNHFYCLRDDKRKDENF
jgi:hypothetical protein